MTNHPSDDFDDLLRHAAQDYNKPDDTPRERMWAEIRARRLQRPADVRQSWRRGWYIPAAAAAVLVLGIAIGRVYERLTVEPPHRVAATPDTPRVLAAIPTPDSLNAQTSPETTIAKLPSPDDIRTSPRRDRAVPSAMPGTRAPVTGGTSSMAYRLAVVEHLAGTEAMLTSFRAAAKRGEVDAQITTWARNLLTTTRLLQTSAAQEDPTMKRLLDDLELVLVQIAQYTSAGPHHAEELELIEHSIERRGVIGKLHTNSPARFAPAGT
jgi:hypothetical protein